MHDRGRPDIWTKSNLSNSVDFYRFLRCGGGGGGSGGGGGEGGGDFNVNIHRVDGAAVVSLTRLRRCSLVYSIGLQNNWRLTIVRPGAQSEVSPVLTPGLHAATTSQAARYIRI